MESKLCLAVLTKGRRKGLPCGRKVGNKAKHHCNAHASLETDVAKCCTILTKGVRRLETCNRKVNASSGRHCGMHMVMEAKRPHNPYTECESDVFISLADKQVTSLDGKITFDIEFLNDKLRKNLEMASRYAK